MGSHKAWITLLLLLALGAVPYLHPSLERYRALRPEEVRQALLAPWKGGRLSEIFRPAGPASSTKAPEGPTPAPGSGPAAPAVPEEPPLPGWPEPAGPPPDMADRPLIEDPGHAMDAFYRALERTRRGLPGAITRISHFGDSPITGDLVSGDIRARLQVLFGDAGHGWTFVARPWEWYRHRGIRLDADGWEVESPMLPAGRPGRYGLGGARFSSALRDSVATIELEGKGKVAGAERVEIHFRTGTRGGTLVVSLDGGPPLEIPAGELPGNGIRTLRASTPARRITLRPKGDGRVTVYGVVLERDVPGVVYDTLGANGSTIRHLTLFDPEDWTAELAVRRPDLVILNYGTNESGYANLSFARYARDYREVVRRIRSTLPEASILVMAPMDRGVRGPDGRIATQRMIPRLVEAQRVIARKEGCAFFDTFHAMGGRGTMARWYANTPRLVTGDLIHPTHAGARVVGNLLVDAILEGFGTFSPGIAPAPPPS